MSQLRFDQFRKLLSDAEVPSSTLLPAVRTAMSSYRFGQLARVDDDEEAVKQIFDDAYAAAGMRRIQQRTSKSEVGTPNLTRHEKLNQNNESPKKREEAEAVYFYLQLDEFGLEYADQISAELFESKTFYQRFFKELRKLGIDVPSTGDGMDSFHLGGIKIRLTEAPDGRPLALPPSNRESLFDGDQLIPSEALKWNNLVSDLVGRDGESEAIKAWADDDELDAKVHLLCGPGGVGKTRMAASMAQRLPEWQVGFLPSDVNNPNLPVELRGGGVGTLVIIDYPEERPSLVEALFKSVAMGQQYTTPVRFLLVSRENELAWRDFPGARSIKMTTTPLELKGALETPEALKLVDSVLEYFADDPRSPDIDAQSAEDWLAIDVIHRKPLFALAATIHALTSPAHAFTLNGRDLLLALAELELSRVRRFSARSFPKPSGSGSTKTLEKLLALGTFHDSGVTKDALYELGDESIAPGIKSHDLLERVTSTPFWNPAPEVGQAGYLEKPTPDILGAAILYLALIRPETPDELPVWIGCVAKHSGDGFLSILSRLSFDLVFVDPEASRLVETVSSKMVEKQPELASHFSSLMFKNGSVFSAVFQKKLLTMALLQVDDDEGEKRAVLSNNLANVLFELGFGQEALVYAREAVELYGKLAKAYPDAVLPRLAGSLRSLAKMLSELGLPKEALIAAMRSVELYRRMMETHPDGFIPESVVSLNIVSSIHSDLGQWQDALIASEKALECFRELSETSTHLPTPDLASSLNDIANTLSDLGRHEDALTATHDAAELYRKLAKARPDAFSPVLASCLNNLANTLSELGYREEALAASQEAVGLLRKLAEARTDVFLPDLSTSLNNLANRFSDLGRYKEALSVSLEAVQFYRELVGMRPNAFMRSLAIALNTLSNRLSELDYRDESLSAAQEAVELFRKLTEAQPNALRHYLAIALNTLASRLFEVGRREDALAATNEAIAHFRSLTLAHPDAFLPNLAISLNNLSTRLFELGKINEGLSAAEEALALYRELAEVRPDAFMPSLAMLLNNIAGMVSELGRYDEALAYAQEAVKLYRKLAKTLPDIALPNLASSLNNLASQLIELGKREEALSTAAEAVAALRPYFLALPQAHMQNMRVIVSTYQQCCKWLGVDPDMELLFPVLETFNRLAGDNDS